MEAKSNSPKETKKIASKLASGLKEGNVIALYGDLGSGKTVFVQGLAKGLGVKRRILSPTFVFMRQYPLKLHGKSLMFYHLDLYRGEDENDFKSLGLEEVFSGDSIVVLEWAEKIRSILPKKRVDVIFEVIGEDKRKIIINRHR